MELLNANATISADLLRVMQRSGIRWGVVTRFHSTLKEAQAYAYGNTVVFPVTGDDEHVFLLAMTEGTYATGQIERYGSGLWAGHLAADWDDAMAKLEEMVGYIGERLLREYERARG